MKNLLLLLSLLPLASCAATGTVFSVNVDGRAMPETGGDKTYVLQSNNDRDDPLLWAEFSVYLERALGTRGYRQVSSVEEAELVVLADWSIRGEEYMATYQEPVWGQVGSTTTYSNNTNPYLGYEATETTTPEYGITHYETHQSRAVRHHRAVDVSAHRRDGAGTQLVWETRIRSTGSSGDLRRVFPVLLAAAEPYLGRSTGRQIHVELKESDDSVSRILGLDS